jgi:hypothetical protein
MGCRRADRQLDGADPNSTEAIPSNVRCGRTGSPRAIPRCLSTDREGCDCSAWPNNCVAAPTSQCRPRPRRAFQRGILFGVAEQLWPSGGNDPAATVGEGWWGGGRRVAAARSGATVPEVRARAGKTKNFGAGGGVGAVVVHQWVGGGGGRPTLRRGVFVMPRGPLPPGCPCPGPRSLGPAELKRSDVQDDQRSQCDDQGSQRVHFDPILADAFVGWDNHRP